VNKPPPNLDEYFAEARSWGMDRTEMLRSQLKNMWRILIAIFTIALLEGIALILLTPLKTVVPYTLLVDRHTGYVQLLKPLDEASLLLAMERAGIKGAKLFTGSWSGWISEPSRAIATGNAELARATR